MSIEVRRIGALGQKNTDTEGLYRWGSCEKRGEKWEVVG